MNPHTLSAFVDELSKIAFAESRMAIPHEREGRRPISVDKLLDRDKHGKLYKKADSQGNVQDVRGDSSDDPGAARKARRDDEGPTKDGTIPVAQKTGMVQGSVFSEGPGPFPMGESPNASPEAKKPRKKGDVPSKDDSNVVDRYDAREFATTVTGLGQSSSDIGAMNHPTTTA